MKILMIMMTMLVATTVYAECTKDKAGGCSEKDCIADNTTAVGASTPAKPAKYVFHDNTCSTIPGEVPSACPVVSDVPGAKPASPAPAVTEPADSAAGAKR